MMKIPAIQQRQASSHLQVMLKSDPLMISESGYQAFLARLERITLGAHELLPSEFSPAPAESSIKMVSGVPVVEVHGVIGKNLEPWEVEFFGMVDLNDVRAQLAEAAATEADVVILDIDSPGGFSTGVHELASDIASSEQFTIGFTDSCMCSGAYYLGAAAKHLVASPSASLGSIGAYTVLADASRMYQQAGVDVEVIRSGDFKGGAVEGAEITEKARFDAQKNIDGIGEQFRQFVAENRPSIEMENMEGQVFLGREALDNGFSDDTANSLEALVYSLVD